MRIARILLLLSLLAVGLYSRASSFAPAQKPDIVTIRSGSTVSQRGIPEVKAVADRTRIPVGDQVKFTLSPASVIKDPCYQVTLFFGDKDNRQVMRREIMRQPQTVHTYDASGNYTYSILVRPVAGCGATQTPTPLPIPDVRLIVKPSAVDVNQTATFVAELSGSVRGLVYHFVFDDGSETGWQNDPKASHAYAAPKTYRPYVEIRLPAGLAARPVVGSQRQPVEVRKPPPPLTINVTLSANPREAEEKTPITFTAQATASRPIRMKYRFNFGDQSDTKWQNTPAATHRYKPGSYTARVEVAPLIPAAVQGSISDPITIKIARPQDEQPSVDLKVVLTSVLPGIPVFFTAIARGADSQTRYRFRFGDNLTSDWSPQATQTHAYASPGNYQASVEMRTSDARFVSPNRQITIIPIFPTPTPTVGPTPPGSPTPTPSGSPTPTSSGSPTPTPSGSPTPSPSGSPTPSPSGSPTPSPSGSPTPTATATPPVAGRTWPLDWWPLPLILLLVLAGYKAARYFLVPRPTFVPHPTAGDAKASGLALDYQVDVDPNVDGAFKIDAAGGNLIKAKRTSDD